MLIRRHHTGTSLNTAVIDAGGVKAGITRVFVCEKPKGAPNKKSSLQYVTTAYSLYLWI
jgi:hypothetical protein